MKQFLGGMGIMTVLLGWIAWFWYLFTRAAMSPKFSVVAIAECVAYVIVSAGIWVWLRTEGPFHD